MQMDSLLIVTGLPGAGKSTVAKLLADSTARSALVVGDAVFGFLASGAIEPWLTASHEQNTVVTKAAGRATGEFVAGGYSVVYDGVIGPWFLDTFLTTAGLSEANYAVLLPTVGVCQRRVAERTGHGFADLAAAASMHQQFANEDLASRHLIPEHNTPTKTVASIQAAATSGQLRHSLRDSRSRRYVTVGGVRLRCRVGVRPRLGATDVTWLTVHFAERLRESLRVDQAGGLKWR